MTRAAGAAGRETRGDLIALPLVVAVTGHRDLVATEIPTIRQQVRSFFRELQARHGERSLRVMTALAEGADRLVAEEAVALGLELVVPVPMPRGDYAADFRDQSSAAEFERLASRAAEVFELPLAPGVTAAALPGSADARARQYAQLGVFLCAHCHILLALWDGKPSSELGGTGQVVRFHHDDVMPGYTTASVASQRMLVDDESDLVYHIVCSRSGAGGAPHPDLRPLDWWWFTKDPDCPRSKELPAQHRLIFRRSAEFSRDWLRYARRIEDGKYPLLDPADRRWLPPGIEAIDRLFGIADWLAIHYRKRTLASLGATHALAFLMGLMFILYSDLATWRVFLLAFLLFFALAAGVQFVARRRGWYRKYLDYRALAEGLRVQFYWAAAGVTNDSHAKFAHDNFLQAQDPELGWIRNVMRVAGLRCDAAPAREAEGIRFAAEEWIGSRDAAQLGYFRQKVLERIRRSARTERLAIASLLASVAGVALLFFTGAAMPPLLHDPLIVLMGTTLLLFGIRRGYAHSTAEKELINQYEFMLRIFDNARRRMESADDPDEQRRILKAVGDAALDEHAEWILLHRDRAIDQGKIWRMGG